MATRVIREYGDDILTKPCKDVKEMTPRLKELVADMLETMHEADGVGLAAPQVGVLKKIFVVDTTGEDPYVFVNPEVIETHGTQDGYEGCLSLPGMSGIVTRPNYVRLRAFNENMEPFEMEADELLARAILHECDHLVGEMYVEHVRGELVHNEDLTEEDIKAAETHSNEDVA